MQETEEIAEGSP